ncbi:SDR family oxidoreductase [uncultured Ferrovibrio sp.]|jgi:NAD(P)-dependent dehydrogenase (short-subunit alcohol dehydrogenase family)|uniref:SDR family oxidoreductase n=1 Tax=uncultured Ferrovibrio sp. TaxID=1576913 RepID=UPI002604F994|nr:SDR family oxidoreductase [uncultured Ferrovibrio sp.]
MAKTILITGGSRGIGRATAILAGQRGWSVGVNYAGNAAAAEQVVKAVQTAGGKAIAIKGDVSLEADVIAVFDAVEKVFGKLDGFVNNAGVLDRKQPFLDYSLERMKRIFDINVLGAYLCAREAARRMAKSRGGKGGSIVNVSSVAARLGAPDEYVDYAGSKGAIDSMTLGLAKELGPEGIRVNAVRPGLIETDIHASGGQPDRAARLGAMTPLGRPGSAQETAEAIIWLLDDAASYVSGALLDISGGR